MVNGLLLISVRKYNPDFKSLDEFYKDAFKAALEVIGIWVRFEYYVKGLTSNRSYFKETVDLETGEKLLELNFVNYYERRTLINPVPTTKQAALLGGFFHV